VFTFLLLFTTTTSLAFKKFPLKFDRGGKKICQGGQKNYFSSKLHSLMDKAVEM
jgi:hypothetical protein